MTVKQCNTFFFLVLIFSFLACNHKSSKKTSSKESKEVISPKVPSPKEDEHDEEFMFTGSDTIPYVELQKKLPSFDLNQDLSGKSLEELRILRNTIPARYGYLFMKADLRYYFYNTSWYRAIMQARWYGDCENSGLKPAPPIEYTPEETAFIEKVKKLEEEKKAQNYITKNGFKYANIKNIVNAWQYNKFPTRLIDSLGKNGFAIVPNSNVQLFHLYEQNDYSQTQNFVSTDLYLQLFHMHFSFMLRGLEENQFVGILGELLKGFHDEADKFYVRSITDNAKNAIQFNSAFYSIPLISLGAKNVEVPESYQDKVSVELENIHNEKAEFSALVPSFKEIEFPYDLFKPRGHYTRTDTLKRYFKSMQWLQTAPYCLEDKTDLTRAVVAAYILNNGHSPSGKSLKDLYLDILEPTSFFVGEPDNLSIIDVCSVIGKRSIKSADELVKEENLTSILAELKEIEVHKNVIKPKVENTCPAKINFMPSRFVLDNEILQEMTDLNDRPFPMGLDVMASFGSKAAQDVLVNELHEDEKWDKFLPSLEKMKAKYKNYENWDATIYAKWVQGLIELLKPNSQYPYFMQLPSWNKKNLNTALASWSELKHDAILYTEQPFAAECGDGGDCPPPPEPFVMGYVEPNTNYWKSALELLDVTDKLLADHNLLNRDIKYKQSQLRELCTFLLAVSEKELKGEALSEQEYRTIEIIGSSVDNITLNIIGVYDWSSISGPDKEIAVVADVYTNNIGEKAGILHEAVGYANDLYVLVEIEGYLYITKGATFSYYEFSVPLDQRMTDEEWQKMLKSGSTYPTPPWTKDVIINLDKSIQPEVKEYLYSSGC